MHILYCSQNDLQGGAIMRAAKRMAARVGYDPDTGLHLAETPQVEEEPMILEDGKTILNKLSHSLSTVKKYLFTMMSLILR